MDGDSPKFPSSGRLLAIDAGQRRVGVAVCDEGQAVARPLAVLVRRSLAGDLERLGRVAAAWEVVGLVVGHPLNADGSAGPQARQSARYAHRLANALGLPVVLWDEYGSSVEARERLRAAGHRLPDHIDAEAAAVILQSFLDERREPQPPASATLDPNQRDSDG